MMQAMSSSNGGATTTSNATHHQEGISNQPVRITVGGGKGVEGGPAQRSQTLEKPAASHTLLVSTLKLPSSSSDILILDLEQAEGPD